jgi:hypothetical protein
MGKRKKRGELSGARKVGPRKRSQCGRERGRSRCARGILVKEGPFSRQCRPHSEDGSSSSRPTNGTEPGLKPPEVPAGGPEEAAGPHAGKAPEDGSAERAQRAASGREGRPHKLPAESRGEREEPESDENEKEASGVLRESGVVAPIYSELEEDDAESDLDIGSPERPVVRGQQVRLTTEDFDLNN